ncbi:type II secretion system protein GspD [Rhodocyclaceae bacterium]|nr:type II secretion system protein GspD [Rhodocyclaceae bacterium]
MFAAPPPRQAVRLSGGRVSLRFEQAPVTDVVHAILGDILKVPYSINQPIGGSITLHTHSDLPRDQVFAVFESALQANGLLVVRDAAGVYHVGRPETMRGVAPAFTNTSTLSAGQSMVIVPLQYVGAAEMADILKPIAAPEAFVRIDSFRNLLVLAGSRGQLDSWLEIINTFDIDILQGMSLGLFPLQYSTIAEVEAGLRAVLAGTGTTLGAGAPTGGQSASGGSQKVSPNSAQAAGQNASLQLPSPIAGVVRVVGIERLNALLVITPRAHYLDIARDWIAKLDKPRTGGSESQLYVYPVQNGTAKHLAGLLTAIFGGETQTSTSSAQRAQRSVAPGLGSLSIGGRATQVAQSTGSANTTGALDEGFTQTVIDGSIRVVADERNNALLLYAPPSEYRKIEAALKRLDVAPTQVLIEASIVEITLTDELRYGLQWYFNDTHGSWSGRGQLTSGNTNAIGPVNPGFSYSIVNAAGEVRAVLSALAEKSLVNVISSPSVLVQDNHTATIQVGDQQPIRSATTVTDGGTTTSSIQYKDTGVALAVTPSVNAGGMVSMDVQQAVTDVGQVDSATGQRSFLQRQFSSRVTVRSGETVVLGGLIRDNSARGKQGVPLLQDIPVLGNLFATTTNNGTRTELLVMITPRVVRSDEELRTVTAEMRGRVSDSLKSLRGWAADMDNR